MRASGELSESLVSKSGRETSVKVHLKYARYVLRHKWFVFRAACKLGIPWLGIIHDWSKLMPSEWIPYARFFYKPTDTGDAAFDFAWLLHQKRNKHHWQWWVLPEDEGGLKVLPMSDRYRREMLADWRGAGRAQGYGDNTCEWYEANKTKMQLHPDTREWIEKMLALQKRDRRIRDILGMGDG